MCRWQCQVHKSCNVGVIEPIRDLEGPREECAICEEYPLVPCFEGEEDNQAEMMDLPICSGFPCSKRVPSR